MHEEKKKKQLITYIIFYMLIKFFDKLVKYFFNYTN